MSMRLNPRKYKLEFVNFIVGAAVLTFELTAARVVAPYIGTSIYIWTSIIGVILAALALGYSVGGKLADTRKRSDDIVALLLMAAGLILLVNFIKDPLLTAITANSIPLQWQALLASILLFAAPTFVLGMVSPYLARLNITKLSTSGQKLASISAWGTAGSLVGTFLTGYVLFGFVGTRYLLGGVSLVLLLITFAMSARDFLGARLAVLLLTIISLASPPALGFSTVLAEVDTRYSRVTVRDVSLGSRPVRVLQTDRQYWQSGVFRDGDKSLVFPYTQAFYIMSLTKPEAGNHLVIGGGAFTFPEYLANKNPQSKVDVVEIDGGLADISKKYFGFKQPDNLEMIIADGRQYLNTNDKKYDFIYLDAFSSVEPPFQLFTKQAAQKTKDSLVPDGMLVVNVIAAAAGPDSAMVKALIATYGQIFKHVEVYAVDSGFSLNQKQNLILTAGSQPRTNLLDSLRIPSDNFESGQVLTDGFAPVERMTSRGI